MKWHRLTALAIALLLSLAAATPQEADPPPPPAPKPQFFAGTVIEIDQVHVKVSRTLFGRPNEARGFLIDAKTKINRTLVKAKARVTVRYLKAKEGDVALEIQLRPAVHASKP